MIELIHSFFDFIGGAVCHQIPDRTFNIAGYFLPLCIRCTGIHSAIFLSTVFLFLFNRTKGNKPFTILQSIFAGLCFIPLIVDGGMGFLGFVFTNNTIRFITGVLFGAFIPAFVILLKNYRIETKGNIKIYNSIFEMFAILFASFSVFWIVKIDSIIIWFILSIGLCLSVTFVYYFIISALIFNIKIFTTFSNNKKRIISFALSVFLIVVASLVNGVAKELINNTLVV